MPTIRKGNVAVVAIVDTPTALDDCPVSVEPLLAEVPKEAFAKTAAKAVARFVRVRQKLPETTD
jgi:hypothetical protein